VTTYVPRLRFTDHAPNGLYGIGRRAPTRSFRGTLHTHEFAEVMWIEGGAVEHLINDGRRLLETGDVVFVRPDDVHTVVGSRFVQVVVAVDRKTVAFLENRYFSGDGWPWRRGPEPATYRLDRRQLARLVALARLLATAAPSRLLLERFLLELFQELTGPTASDDLPPWLQQALRRLADDPQALASGVPALASFAGRSREHVNRVARATTGRRATDLVNEARLARAAAELTLTDEPIVRIAADCGLPNLSHFYRLFNARFGVTPRAWRVRHRALL
jgi:AraC family cel operon transcriptional repressor